MTTASGGFAGGLGSGWARPQFKAKTKKEDLIEPTKKDDVVDQPQVKGDVHTRQVIMDRSKSKPQKLKEFVMGELDKKLASLAEMDDAAALGVAFGSGANSPLIGPKAAAFSNIANQKTAQVNMASVGPGARPPAIDPSDGFDKEELKPEDENEEIPTTAKEIETQATPPRPV